MFSFSAYIDLPLIWFGLISTAIFLYVVLDGFDLGVGILFPFAPTDRCRDRMMNSIAPFWDGNETWLVLGGGGLFAAFPLAYAVIMPAHLLSRHHHAAGAGVSRGGVRVPIQSVRQSRILWDYAFHFGSMAAAFMQGMFLGAFVQGISRRRSQLFRRRFRLAECLQHDDGPRAGVRLHSHGRRPGSL